MISLADGTQGRRRSRGKSATSYGSDPDRWAVLSYSRIIQVHSLLLLSPLLTYCANVNLKLIPAFVFAEGKEVEITGVLMTRS